MQSVQFDSKEQLANAFGSASNAHNVPAKASASPAQVERANPGDTANGSRSRTFLSRTLRFARNAAIGLVAISAIPLSVIGYFGSRSVRHYNAGTNERVLDANRSRALMAPRDAAITPMEAGVAYHALQLTGPGNSRSPYTPAPRAWESLLTKEMFTVGTAGRDGPSPQNVVLLVSGGYSAAEMAYLRAVAESPVWLDFDRVANANIVDMIGGANALPFRSDANVFDLQLTRYADIKSLADAGVSRAAYFLATKDEVRAEAALRSIVSFGFAMIDNGHSAMDGLIGRVVVGVGRNGLDQFNLATHRAVPEAEDASYRPFPKANAPVRINAATLRAQLVADANNTSLPQSLRFESLQGLALSSCSSVPEVLFGPGDAVVRAFKNAEQTLPRTAADKAYLELLRDSPNRPLRMGNARWGPDQFLFGAADITAAITRTPRIATCTRMVVLGR